jgi:hypothetical protein
MESQVCESMYKQAQQVVRRQLAPLPQHPGAQVDVARVNHTRNPRRQCTSPLSTTRPLAATERKNRQDVWCVPFPLGPISTLSRRHLHLTRELGHCCPPSQVDTNVSMIK